MNRLSWLIYWADTLPKVSTWLCFVSFLGFLIFGVITLLGATNFFGDGDKHEELGRTAERFRKVWFAPVIFFLLWGGSFLVPEKDTFYLIAASEAGEEITKTPEVAKVRQVINKWLDAQIEPEEKGTEQ